MNELAQVLGRVLIVDDNPGFRDAARLLLTAEGIQVLGVAASVAEGLGLVRSQHPDLVLLDVSLPDGSGFELCERLLELDQQLRVIIISSRDGAGYSSAALASGARGFLAKSGFSTGRLSAILKAPWGS